MVNIDRLSVEEALAIAEKMRERNRIVLCHQILDQLELRRDKLAEKQKTNKRRCDKPRRRDNRTGELV